MKLDHFSEYEYRCKGDNCCGGLAILDREFALKMDCLRYRFGKVINISSGFRCLSHNKKVGGVDNSNHTKGRAWDIYPNNAYDLIELYKMAKNYFNEVILYDENGFIHVGDKGA